MTTFLATTRGRLVILGAVLVVAVALVTVYFVRAAGEQARSTRPTAATAKDTALDLGAVLDAPHIVFRSTSPGPTYGMLAAVPLADPAGARSVSDLSCDRVHAGPDAGICLIADRGAVTSYRGELLDGRMQPSGKTVPVNGSPSRARLSPDGTLAATTVFVAGHGYGTIGFSTETVINEVGSGPVHGNLETSFATLDEDGRKVTAADLNIWGVTFPAGPAPGTFYATYATGGRTWLARGDLRARTLTAVRGDAECPSLSPDGKRLVYKKRAGSPIAWRYHVLDVATGVETPLAETRSIDDQAEWLDDTHVLYGLQRPGTGEADVWVADVTAPGEKPRVLVPDAWSPAVVRDAAG